MLSFSYLNNKKPHYAVKDLHHSEVLLFIERLTHRLLLVIIQAKIAQ